MRGEEKAKKKSKKYYRSFSIYLFYLEFMILNFLPLGYLLIDGAWGSVFWHGKACEGRQWRLLGLSFHSHFIDYFSPSYF